jgi:MinD superfamily P-loop ATPase
MIYNCKKCKDKKELTRSTTVLRDGKWVTKEAYCKKCKAYMTSKPTEGFPELIRTEPTLKKNDG